MGQKDAQTTTQKIAPDPGVMRSYQQLMERAQGVASTPYNAYSGDLTAGVNQQQNLGISNINQYAGWGQPYFQQAGQYAGDAAHALTPADIERYQNPYTQNVVNATQAQFDRSNQQSQERLQGQAIAQGALGGSRAKIAAADLGYQQQLGQAPVIAGLYNQGYNQAVQTAQQQQGAAFQGANTLAGVGAAGQQAGLQGAGAQIGAGTLQQQAEQQRLSALYNQYQIAQAFPYQQAQWLAGIDTGVGSQMGGTSTTTAPAPSLLSQLSGAALAGVGVVGGTGGFGQNGWVKGMFAKDGGRIDDYDAGGSVGADPYGGVGWIPQNKIAHGPGAPRPPAAAQQPHPSFDPSKFGFPRQSAGVGAGEMVEGEAAPLGGASYADFLAADAAPESAAEVGASFMPGWLGSGMEGVGSSLAGVGSSLMSALPEGVAAALPFLLLNRGGGVRGYANAGPVLMPAGGPPDWPDKSQDAIDADVAWAEQRGPAAPEWLGDTKYALANGPSPYYQPKMSFPTLSSRPEPSPVGVGAPPVAPPVDRGVAPPPDYRPTHDDSGLMNAGVGAAPAPSPQSGGFNWSNLSMPLITAGLGMMASRSPHALVGIGEGGLQGVQAYAQQQRQTAEQGLAEKKQALDSRRLDEMANQHREMLKQKTKEFNLHKEQFERPYSQMTAQQTAQLAEQKRQHDIAAGAPVVIPYGAGVMNKSGQMIREPGLSEGSDYDPNPPSGADGGTDTALRRDPVKPPAMAGASSEALAAEGERYALTGKVGAGYNNNRDPIQAAQSRAIKSYGVALARSRGMGGEELAQMWQNSPRWAGWIMGADGRAVGALGTAVDHLDTARDLFKELNNGNFRLTNDLKNRFFKQFGYEAPTNVEAVAQIVGVEVMKAVGAAGAGSKDEREAIAKVVGDLARSPAQAEGGIDSLQKLIAGQLRTKQRQADAIDLPKGKFEKLVGERGLDVLKNIDKKPDPLPEAAIKALKEGTQTTFNNGQVWTLRNGQPVRVK